MLILGIILAILGLGILVIAGILEDKGYNKWENILTGIGMTLSGMGGFIIGTNLQ